MHGQQNIKYKRSVFRP